MRIVTEMIAAAEMLKGFRESHAEQFKAVQSSTRESIGHHGDVVRACFLLKGELARWPGEYWEV